MAMIQVSRHNDRFVSFDIDAASLEYPGFALAQDGLWKPFRQGRSRTALQDDPVGVETARLQRDLAGDDIDADDVRRDGVRVAEGECQHCCCERGVVSTIVLP